MRRNAHNRMWTLLFTLLLCVASTVSLPSHLRADVVPSSDPAPPTPPDPQGGDPDWPTNIGHSPKPGAARGRNLAVARGNNAAARRDQFSVWMIRVRMAFATGFRVFFRF